MAFQKTLTEPGAATAVAPDTTKAQAIEAIGGLGVQAFEGYQTAGLKDELTSTIEQTLTPEIPAGTAEGAVQDAEREVAKLETAQKAGRISSTDLETRVSAITRKYIRKVPGMADTFRGIRSKLVGDYAAEIQALEAAEKDATQRADFLTKRVYTEAQKMNIDITKSQPEVFREYQTRVGAMQEAGDYELIENLEGLSEKAKDREAFARFDTSSDGELYLNIPKVGAIVASDLSTEDKLLRVQNLGSEIEFLFNSKYDRIPVEKRNAKLNTIKTYIQNQVDFLSGKTPLEVIENDNKRIEADAVAGLNKITGYPEASVFLSKHGVAIGGLLKTEGGIQAVQTLTDTINKAFSGNTTVFSTAEEGRNYRETVKNIIATVNEEGVETDDVTEVVPLFDKILSDNPEERDPRNYDVFIDIMADPNTSGVLNNIVDGEAKRVDYLDKLNDYLVQEWKPRFTQDINEDLSEKLNVSKAWAFGGKELKPLSDFINAEITDDGKLIFRAAGLGGVSSRSKPVINQKVNRLNTIYSARFNKTVQARGNMIGSTDFKEGAGKLWEAVMETPITPEQEPATPTVVEPEAPQEPVAQKLEPGTYIINGELVEVE